MKTIKLLFLIPILGLASSLFAASITITGTVTDFGSPKSGVQVIWTDSSTMNSDTAMTNSSGMYSITLNTGSATQGMAFGYIIDCNSKSVYSDFFYNPSSSTYSRKDFVYCTNLFPYNSTVSGTISNIGSGSVTVYADTLGGQFSNWSQNVTSSSNSYSFTIGTWASPQDVWVYIVDCKNDTIMKKVIVTLSSPNRTNVNFNYCSNTPPSLSTVSGTVHTGVNVASNAVVLLIKNDSNILSVVDTAQFQAGRYSVTIPDSSMTYMVKAVLLSGDPYYASFLPTYSDSALNWSNAYVIPASNNTTFTRDIHMVAGTNPGGPGFIGGNVGLGANKTSAVGDPVSGILVMALQNNKPVAYSHSDAQGNFKIENLAYGTYTVYAEVLGKATSTVDVTLSVEAPNTDAVKVAVNSSGVTTWLETTGIESYEMFAAIKAFPNPVNDLMTVQFGEELNVATLSIIDITGKAIAEQHVENSFESTLSFENLESGSYLIKIETPAKTGVIRVVKQ